MLAARATPILLLLALAAGCDAVRQQACVPGESALCAPGETCAVDATGTPTCTLPGEAIEGALCRIDEAADGAELCAETYGCLRVAGVSRCLKFCDPVATTDPCGPQGDTIPVPITRGGRHPTWPWSSCAAVLPERVDIGACVLPCRLGQALDCPLGEACPEHPGDCPDGTTCGVALGAPFPVCMPIGVAGFDRPCGGGGLCAAGLVCARADDAARCQLPAVVTDGNVLLDPCPNGGRPRPLAGAFDPTTGVPFEVCLP